MKYVFVDFYKEFHCVGSECPDTCCAGWGIGVDEQAVSDYRSVSGPFGEKLKNAMYSKDNVTYMKLDQANRCMLLDEQNLCEIYRELGPERMCYTCRSYPREFWQYEDLALGGLNISCPEVARMLFSRTDPILIGYGEDDFPALENGDDDGLFNLLINGLITSVNLLQNRSLSLSVRLRLLILFHDALQECLDSRTDPSSIFESFASPEQYHALAETLGRIPTDHASQILMLRQLLQFDGLYRIDFLFKAVGGFLAEHPDLILQTDAIEKLFAPFCLPDYTVQYENYAVNYILNNYLEAGRIRNIRDMIATFVYLYVLQMTADVFIAAESHTLPNLSTQVMIFSKTARFFNHNEQKLKELFKNFLESGFAETTALLTIV